MNPIIRIPGKVFNGKTAKTIIVKLIVAILIALFVYTSLSNLIGYSEFKSQLLAQPFPNWISTQLAWAIPSAGLIAAGMISVKHTRRTGFYVSLTLLVLFTLYIVLLLLKAFDYIPCACVGVLKDSTWAAQLSFNAFFILLSSAGIIITNNRKEEL